MKSKRRMIAWITTAVTVAVLATLLWATGSVQAGPLAQVPLRITYQGRLTEPGGNPLTGNYDFTFKIYSAQSGGTLLWSETQNNVSVDDGVFTVQLGAVTPLDPADFDGSSRWLEVSVRETGVGSFTTLSPRQQLVSAPYALRARDADLLDGQHASAFASASHDHWGESWTGSGTGLTLSGGTTGLSGSGSTYGLRGSTSATSGTQYGVYGTGDDYGVYGTASGSSDYGVYGVNNSSGGYGVYGTSSSGTGVQGYGEGYGVYGTATGSGSSGVYGTSSSGSGVGARNNNTSYYALWGYSDQGSSGYGLGVNSGQVRFQDYVTFAGGKSGYVVEIALNDDNVPLEQGDVVVISGYGPPVVGRVPVIKVRKATDAYATGVIGVVDVLYEEGPKLNLDQLENVAPSGGFRPEVTTIQPGQYLSIVTLGAYQGVKVDTGQGEVRPGDLLVSAGTAGQAMAAQSVLVEGVPIFPQGAIVGKLLGPPDPATGLAPIFVTLH